VGLGMVPIMSVPAYLAKGTTRGRAPGGIGVASTGRGELFSSVHRTAPP